MLYSFKTAMVSWQIRHTAFDRTSVKKYLLVHSLLNTRHSLSTFLFFGPLIVADGFFFFFFVNLHQAHNGSVVLPCEPAAFTQDHAIILTIWETTRSHNKTTTAYFDSPTWKNYSSGHLSNILLLPWVSLLVNSPFWYIACWPGVTGYDIMFMWSCDQLYMTCVVFYLERGRSILLWFCVRFLVWWNLLCWAWHNLATTLLKIELLWIDGVAVWRDAAGTLLWHDISGSDKLRWLWHSHSVVLWNKVTVPLTGMPGIPGQGQMNAAIILSIFGGLD